MSTVWDRMTELATCLCATITDRGLPPVCFCGIMPGGEVAYDYVDSCDGECGMAWVRLVGTYPSAQVGVPDVNLGNCSAMLGFDVEVGIVRCAPAMDSQGNPAPGAEQLAAADLQVADMLAAREAIICCQESNGWILSTYVPVGPEGGAVGGFWTVSMQEV